MSISAYPVLCGGSFFTLVLEAHKPRTGKKEQLYGKRDGLSEPETLAALLQVMYPEYQPPSSNSAFKTATSEYKLCKSNGTNMPFYEQEIRAFDNRIKNDYQTALMKMIYFVDGFIEVGSSVKRDEQLVKALLELIEADQSIGENDLFYITRDGTAMSKSAMRQLTEVCLPSFMLGVWHFVVINRQDNKAGKDTLDQWCPSNNRKPRVYSGAMGEGITRDIKVIPIDVSEFETDAEYVDEPFAEQTKPYVEEAADEAVQPVQVINNNGIILQQFGTNNKQITGNVETLIIKND